MNSSRYIRSLKGKRGIVLFAARPVSNKRVPFETDVRIQHKDGSIRQLTSEEAGGVSGGRTPEDALGEAIMLFQVKYLFKVDASL